MNIQVKLLTKEDEQKWTDYLYNSDSPEVSIYHTLVWRDIWVNVFQHKPLYIIAMEEERCCGLLPIFLVKGILGKRIVSMPLRDRCAPIYDNLKVLQLLLEYAVILLKENNCKYFELKSLYGFDIEQYGFFKKSIYIDSCIELNSDPDIVWDKIHDSIKRGVKKSIKCGLTCYTAKSENDIKEFYYLFLLTRKKLGVPPFCFELFKQMYFQLNDSIQFLIIKHNKKAIAGMVLFFFENRVIYAYGASHQDFLQLRPNNLLMWEAIKQACLKGFKYFDFGADPLSSYSLLEFKKRWGAFQFQLPYYYYYNSKEINVNIDHNDIKYKILNFIFQKMPISIAKIIGPYITRQIT